MPQVSPINITVDSVLTELKPVGGNANGTVMYRSSDRDYTASLTPKSKVGSDIDRAQGRINGSVELPDPLDSSILVERTFFGKFEVTKHADIDSATVLGYLIELLQDAQTVAIADGEAFYG